MMHLMQAFNLSISTDIDVMIQETTCVIIMSVALFITQLQLGLSLIPRITLRSSCLSIMMISPAWISTKTWSPLGKWVDFQSSVFEIL